MEKMPEWFNKPIPRSGQFRESEVILSSLKLHTICDSGNCPNRVDCVPHDMAFLLMGNHCTRACTFCSVNHHNPEPLDPDEPMKMVEVAKRLSLTYMFLTSVTRDDLPDGGASHYAETINLLHENVPSINVEVLIPDFKGDVDALKTVIDASPCVLGHNIETVPRLYREMRPQASYQRSLDVLRNAKRLNEKMLTKSGIMLGLGETKEEVIETMQDIKDTGCDMFTLGQYLQPEAGAHDVVRYVTPEEFEEYLYIGQDMGFHGVASFPLMRSSFKAEYFYAETMKSISSSNNQSKTT